MKRERKNSPGSVIGLGSILKITSLPFVKLTVIFIFAVFSVFACTANESGGTYVQIKGNKSFEATVFRQNCAICHGSEADGKVVDGKEVPSLRFGPAQEKSLEEIYDQIANGKLPMPAFKDQLSERIMRNMAVFIYRDLQGRKLEQTDVAKAFESVRRKGEAIK